MSSSTVLLFFSYLCTDLHFFLHHFSLPPSLPLLYFTVRKLCLRSIPVSSWLARCLFRSHCRSFSSSISAKRSKTINHAHIFPRLQNQPEISIRRRIDRNFSTWSRSRWIDVYENEIVVICDYLSNGRRVVLCKCSAIEFKRFVGYLMYGKLNRKWSGLIIWSNSLILYVYLCW